MAGERLALNQGNRLISGAMWSADDEFRELGGREPAPQEDWQAWTLRKVTRQGIWIRLLTCACCDFGRFKAEPGLLAQMFLLGVGGPGIDWYATEIGQALDEFESVGWVYRWTAGHPQHQRGYGVVWPFVMYNRHRWSKASSVPPVPSEAARAEAIRRELPPHSPSMGFADMSHEKFVSLQTWGGSMEAWSRAHPEYAQPTGRAAKRSSRGPKEWSPRD